jgi:hypothetical protein
MAILTWIEHTLTRRGVRFIERHHPEVFASELAERRTAEQFTSRQV